MPEIEFFGLSFCKILEFWENFIEFLGNSSKFMTTSAKFWTLQAYKSHTMCIKMLQKPGLLFLAASSFGTTVYALGPLQNILHLRDGCRNWQSNIESPYLVGGVEAFFLQAVKSMIKCDFLDACKFQSPKAAGISVCSAGLVEWQYVSQ